MWPLRWSSPSGSQGTSSGLETRLHPGLADSWLRFEDHLNAIIKIFILLSDFHIFILMFIGRTWFKYKGVQKEEVNNHFTTWGPSRVSSPNLTSRPRHSFDNKLGKHECTAVVVEETHRTVDYASRHISIRHQTLACGLTAGNCNQLRKA